MSYKYSLLFPLALLLGCPGGGEKPPDGPNPRYEFVQGVKILKTPDRKTQEINYAKALDHFNTAVQLKPDFAPAHVNAAWTAEQLGQVDAAIESYFILAFLLSSLWF